MEQVDFRMNDKTNGRLRILELKEYNRYNERHVFFCWF